MKSKLIFSLVLSLPVIASAGNTIEIWDTRTGEKPSWTKPKAVDEAGEKLAAVRREVARLKWLQDSPVGARDFCSVSAVVSEMNSTDTEPMQCFHGHTSEDELIANGWELTETRKSLHPHSPGYEVLVTSSVAIKKRCVAPSQPTGQGVSECTEQSRRADHYPGLFWTPRS